MTNVSEIKNAVPVPDAISAAPDGARPSRERRGLSRNFQRSVPLLAALVAVCLVFQFLSGLFLSPRNLGNLLTESAPLGFVAVASALMILMGEIDLSLGSVAGLTAAIVAVLMNLGLSWGPAVVVGLLAAAVIGGIQGTVVVVAGVRSFVVTLAGFLICYGLQLRILQPAGYVAVGAGMLRDIALVRIPSGIVEGVLIVAAVIWVPVRLRQLVGRGRRRPLRVGALLQGVGVVVVAVAATMYLSGGGGLPLLTAVVICITGIVWAILRHSGPGRHLYAIGGDQQAAEESGIRVRLVKWSGFVATSVLAGLAGLCLLSYTSGADNTTGTGTLLLAGIGAAVVGGVSLLGGRGSVWGALGGALLLAGVQNGLNLLSLSSDMVYVVEGIVVMAALLVDAGIRRRVGAR